MPNTDAPASGGGPLLQSNDRQKAVDPNPELDPDPEVTSRELRWLRLEGQVEMRGRALSAGVGVEVESDVEAVEAAAKSLRKVPQLPFFGLSTSPGPEFKLGVRFKLRLRCKFMFKSSPVAEGRFPRLIEFLVAFFPVVLRQTLAEFPSSDLQGVMLPTGRVVGVLRLSKADRD